MGPNSEELDPIRRKKGGTAMSDRWAVVEYRGDWNIGFAPEKVFAAFSQKKPQKLCSESIWWC